MKRKITILITLVLLQALTTFAQRDPSKEILIFFKEGVKQEIRIVNGRSLKVADITVNRPRFQTRMYEKSDFIAQALA
jgi:hypothetical protein